MESSECESADDMDAEQLATVDCTSTLQSGGRSVSAMAKADGLAADCVAETIEQCTAQLYSYIPFCARCTLRNCSRLKAVQL